MIIETKIDIFNDKYFILWSDKQGKKYADNYNNYEQFKQALIKHS